MSTKSAAADKAVRAWTAGEVEQLRRLAAEGVRPSVIALRLDRSEAGIKAKAYACGVDLIRERARQAITLRIDGRAQASLGG